MNDFRCGAKFCTRCALSFGIGYQDVEPGRPMETYIPLQLARHADGVVMGSEMLSTEFDTKPDWVAVAQQVIEGGCTPGFPDLLKPARGLPTGYDERKRLQIWTFLTQYFPDAFLAVVDVAVKGNSQHNPNEPLHWARGKSMDQMNTAARHMFDHSTVGAKDTDGCWHLAKAIWRLSAELQLLIEGSTTEGKSDEH